MPQRAQHEWVTRSISSQFDDEDVGDNTNMDKKRLKRQFEYVRYSFYSLSMCCLLVDGGLEYNKVLTNRSSLGLYLSILILSWPGLRALGKLERYVLSDGESETKMTQVLNEGITK